MKNIASLISILFIFAVLSACASPTASTGNSAEQQRRNADNAQRELSTDVNRGSR